MLLYSRCIFTLFGQERCDGPNLTQVQCFMATEFLSRKPETSKNISSGPGPLWLILANMFRTEQPECILTHKSHKLLLSTNSCVERNAHQKLDDLTLYLYPRKRCDLLNDLGMG